jgi:hypothetical protein
VLFIVKFPPTSKFEEYWVVILFDELDMWFF